MKLFLSVLLTFIGGFLLAQETERERSALENVRIKLKGKVADTLTGKGMGGAVVQVLSGNSTTDEENDNFFSRMVIADKDGNFEIENVPFAEQYNIIVSVIGYATYNRTLSFAKPHPEEINRNSVITKDLGSIAITQQAKNLADVVVTATAAPTMQFDIDRKVFNVEKNITAQGGTAVDVMKNIPSVSVDVEGNVQLRNATPQIFVDGRPTILTLDQISADDIERVELITNPSAKFDASNAGGIINIILKKNKRAGFNGLATVGAGAPDVLTGNLNLNLRQNKFNFFASGNYNQSGGVAKEEAYRQNKSNGVITDYFNQTSESERKRKFTSIRFGADYFINEKTTLSFTQGFTAGRFQNNEDQFQEYLDSLQLLDYTGRRFTNGSGNFDRSSSSLSFDKTFERPDKKLTADITYNTGTRGNKSIITNNFFTPEGGVYAPETVVRNEGSGDNDQLTIQADYTNQISEGKRIEFGLRSYLNNNTTHFGTFAVGSGGETKLPLSNNYTYDESVNAGYVNYANKWKGLQYQVGLRVELSELKGELLDSALKFGYKYPDKLKNINDAIFPSLFITKKLSENQDVQFNYSKRIRRPRFWEVNPFVDINDPLNIRQGNPGLRPEYINSFELNYFNRLKGGSFLGVLYFRNNVRDITNYSDTISPQLYRQLTNAGVSPNAILNTFINAGYTNRMGAEFTLQQKFFKNLDLTYNVNFQYLQTNAKVNDLKLSNSGFNWDTKLIANYKITSKNKLFNDLSFQFISEYESPQVIPQGREKEQFVSDFAMRKEFLKNRAASLSFSINDIFNSRRFGTIYDTENFYQDSYRRWNVRTFRITFSYRFGNSDLDLFKKKNNRNNDNNADGGIDEG